METGNNYTYNIDATQVRDSIEGIRFRKLIKLYVFFCIALLVEFAVLMLLFNAQRDELYHVFEVTCILAALFGSQLLLLLSLIIHYAICLKTIVNGVGELPVYKVIFDNVITSAWNGSRFAVEIPDGSGDTVKTRPLFGIKKPTTLTAKSRTYMQALYVDDFKGREILIMYNPKRKKIFVLGFADQFNLPSDTF